MTDMQIVYCVIVVASCLLRTANGGEHPDGESEVSRSQDALGNYHFSYTVNNGEGEQFRQEGKDQLGRIMGSYGLSHVDGTHRVVDYIADEHGFRAKVRSNENGVASADSADASIVRTDHNSPLAVAATSTGDNRQPFGKRLKPCASSVAYVATSSDTPQVRRDTPDEAARESRQRNFDDYRPLSPVAYYPSDVRGPLSPASQRPNDQSRSPRVLSQSPEADGKPLGVYFPPIDPHSAMRRPSDYLPRHQSGGNFDPITTSRQPFIPPYGGFDDDPLPVNRRPGISMSTIHGGLGSGRDLSHPAPTPAYGFGRFPSSGTFNQRDFGLPPLRPGFQSGIPQPPSRVLPSFPQTLQPGALFNPPSYEGGVRAPNFVLRAVPIPNGIQAVRVDPTSGRVYERLMYPFYLRHDGHPTYDRNILLHNDDVGDDDPSRNENSGYYDVPYPGRTFRGARDQPFDMDSRDRTGEHNSSDEKSLSQPTARDFASIYSQLSMIEGFDRDRFANHRLQDSSPFRDSGFDQFQTDRPRYGSLSRTDFGHSLFGEYSDDDTFSRNPRHSDQLAEEGSKAVPSNLENPRHGDQLAQEGSKAVTSNLENPRHGDQLAQEGSKAVPSNLENHRHSVQFAQGGSKAVPSNSEKSASSIKQIETEEKTSQIEKEGN